MFIVLLRFAQRDRAAQAMQGHKQWLQRGFDDGVFLLAGSLQPDLGALWWRIAPRAQRCSSA